MRLRHGSDEGEMLGGEGGGAGIDAVFILNVLNKIFITFILATTFAVAEKDLDVNLPEAKSGREELAETKEVVINVLRDGRMRLGESEYDLDTLVEHLKQVALANAQVPVTIRGDRQTMFENAVRAMDACGRANLHRISFAIVDSKS
jgi:biopolymer transport protein ExbD